MTEQEQFRLRVLFNRFLENRISKQEYDELWHLWHAGAKTEGDTSLLNDEFQLLWEKAKLSSPLLSETEWDEKMNHLMEEVDDQKPPGSRGGIKKLWMKWVAVAAVVVLVMSVGLFLYQRHEHFASKRMTAVQAEKKGMAPGSNKAMLILSNGRRITLDSAVNGVIARQGTSNITKSDSGLIAYDAAPTDRGDVVYNMLSIPRGGKYQIVLADGTKVWLNAASTLRFPSAFPGDERRVEMTGEAYFEIAEDAEKPFTVSVDGMKVNVLGTHFNIMAYDDEPVVKTTLLQGKVRVEMEKGASALLQSGEQVVVDKKGHIQKPERVNTKKAVAWKNDLFWFDRNNIHEVMRQIARWYDADVEIKGEIPEHFTGFIPRDVNVLRVFHLLQETGNIHFKVEGNKIIVTS